MKFIILIFLVVFSFFNCYSQCDSLKIDYQIDHLEKESEELEDFFTDIPEDSLQINLNDGFHNTTVTIKIEGVSKSIKRPTQEDLGFTAYMMFKRPKALSKIEVYINGQTAEIDYNEKYNMIHIWSYSCQLTVRHTNRVIIYE